MVTLASVPRSGVGSASAAEVVNSVASQFAERLGEADFSPTNSRARDDNNKGPPMVQLKLRPFKHSEIEL